MKKLISLAFIVGSTILGTLSYAQNLIVFTSSTNETNHKFWRVNTATPYIYENISQKLDSIAPFEGEDFGPITISHDGNWYSFLSERFDEDTQGWAALTVTNTNLSSYEVIRDSSNQLIHPEGRAFVLSGGQTVIFVGDFGNHVRDIFAIHKTGNNWGMPVNLSENSTYSNDYTNSLLVQLL